MSDLELTAEDVDELAERAVAVRPRYDFQPVMSVEQAIQRKQAITQFVAGLMVKNHDFGIIPGTPKPTLYKPGAERLCSYFGLIPRFKVLQRDVDWTGERHGGEPFCFYEVKCSLYRGGEHAGDGDASCSSFESKYRYREPNRLCPKCQKDTIIKGKEEYGGGWLCFKKKGGCGAKFLDDDAAITKQKTGKEVNPDVCDQFNTVLKMAEKRALIAATLIAVNASEFFTQDIEDYAPTDRDELDHGSRDAQQAVAAKKLDIGKMVNAFRAVKNRLIMHEPKPGLGEQTYYRILGNPPYNAKHANDKQFQENRSLAEACYRDLDEVAKDWESRPSPEHDGLFPAGPVAAKIHRDEG